MKLVFVHGRAQQGKDPAQLQQEWVHALTAGLEKSNLKLQQGVEVIFPYYGDRLDELLQELDAPLVSDVLLRGAAPDSAEAAFRGELLYEIAQGAGVSDAEIQSHFSGTYQEKGPLNWEWVQSILSALDKTPLGEVAIDVFTRDVYVYLTNRSVRKAIDGIVSASMPDGPCVVVGHSLGSVVSYNVLRNSSASVGVRQYVTLGSPLGLNAIKRKLDVPLTMPACVQHWFNAMDKRDVVALHPLDTNNFDVFPAIQNKTDVDNHTPNRHGITGYLDNAIVAKHIYAALASVQATTQPISSTGSNLLNRTP
ncbi:MAG: hypothetical protein M5R41_07135 [Bacteroidia bacterium]|nr:hypothetical protein [Bacteroidia bacterium]